MRRVWGWIGGCFLLGSVALLAPPVLADVVDIELPGGTMMSVESIGDGADRVLWLPSEYGLHGESERRLAGAVAASGVQVWLADLHSSYFLAPGRSSLEAMPREDIRDLIVAAQPDDGQLYLFSYGRGAALLLEAARLWQMAADPSLPPLGGAILIHPNLMAGATQAGAEAQLAPIATASNLPLFVLQPMNSAKRWYVQELVERLQEGGSDVFLRPLADVSDGFQVRDDATAHELAVRGALPGMLREARHLLGAYNHTRREPVQVLAALPGTIAHRVSAGLQPIEGHPVAPALNLVDLEGETFDLGQLRGEVVLLNYWATWCPPCVEEIPSLGRLNRRLAGRPFRVVSIDVGEEAAQVRDFLRKVPAGFPVLLDPDGTTTGPWKIRAFPTSFVVDRQGRLRYGYFGGLAWDSEEVVALIESLLAD